MVSERTPLITKPSPRRPQPSNTTPPAQTQAASLDSSTSLVPLRALDVHAQFCFLVGVPPSNAPPSSDKSKSKSPSWPKNSLYGRATRQLHAQSNIYVFTAALSNTLLLSQVVLGAAVTGLGASASSHILITCFGALNTIIAGLVAYLKSRGQPMRARMYRDDLERVVDEIENSEVMWLGIAQGVQGYGELAEGGDEEVTVRAEVARLTRLYDRAVRNNTANNPDSYVAGPGLDPQGMAVPRPGGLTAAPQPIAVAAPAPAPAAAAAPLPPPPAAPVDPDMSPASAPPKRADTPKPPDPPATAGSSTATLAPTTSDQLSNGDAKAGTGQDASATPATQGPQTSQGQATAPPPVSAATDQAPAAAQPPAPARDENAPGAVAEDDDDEVDPATKKLPDERFAIEKPREGKVELDAKAGRTSEAGPGEEPGSGANATSADKPAAQAPAQDEGKGQLETRVAALRAQKSAVAQPTAPATTPQVAAPAQAQAQAPASAPNQADSAQSQPAEPPSAPARDPDESPASAPPRKKASAKKAKSSSTAAATPDTVAAGKGDESVAGDVQAGKENENPK